MRTCIRLALLTLMVSCTPKPTTEKPTENGVPPAEYAIAIHGGAGTILRENMSPETEAAYRQALEQALDIGENILKNGGSSLDAVERTIVFLEESPLFNAGRGAVFTHEGKNELDASIMSGADKKAGAVGGVTIVKSPIQAARAVMEKSPHVFLTGHGAEQFAIEKGLDTVPNTYFFTQDRWEALQSILEAENKQSGYLWNGGNPDSKFGTVGCVALDKNGQLAAGTSTGGMTNKRYNRIGDSPVIGAGTYADNATCAVSCTGHGEFFIRYAVAHDVSAQMQYGGKSLAEAGHYIINDRLKAAGGEGGLIGVDHLGNIAMPFNTEGMYRAYAKPNERYLGIYKED